MIGRVSDLAINTASTAAHSTAISPTSSELFRIAAAGAMMTALGTLSITRDPFAAGQNGGSECYAARPSGAIRYDLARTLASLRATSPDRGKSALPIVGACRAASRIRASDRGERDSRRGR